MPASPTSLKVTEAFRARVLTTRLRLEREATRSWPTIEGFDGTDWPKRMAVIVAQGQTEAVRATTGYLAAFLSSELGHRTRGPVLDARSYSGVSRDGRSLLEAFESPLIGVKAALKEGKPPQEALAYGLQRATRMVGVDFDAAHRTALLEAIDRDERFEGWQRAVRGTCGACAGAARGSEHGTNFQIHPGCQCVSEPVVRDAPNRFPRPTGPEIFAARSKAEQDTMLGADAAELVRAGEVALADLVEESPLEQGQDFITQRPVAAL